MTMGVARGACQARLCPRRPHRHPVGQPRRIHRRLFRHHARGPGRGAGELPVSEEDHRFHHPRCRRQARVLRPRKLREQSGGSAGRGVRPRGSRGLRPLRRSGRIRNGDPGAARARDVPLHLGLDRRAEGRRALAPEPHLGGGDAAHARSRAASLSDRGAALSHERAGAGQARLRGARDHRAAAEVRGEGLHRGDRAIPPDLAHGGAADDRDDAARARDARRDRSLQRRVHPHGLGAGQHQPDGVDPSRAAEGQGHQRLWHDRSGSGGVRPASARIAAAGQFGRLSASEGASFAWSTATIKRPRRACWR